MSRANGEALPERDGNHASANGAEGFPSFDAVYAELKVMASRQLRHEGGPGRVDTTSLVHEVWLKLGGPRGSWDSRAHFFGAAARAMRQVLIDLSRKQKVRARLGRRTTLAGVGAGENAFDGTDHMALKEATDELAQYDREAVEIVLLHYYGGLSMERVAEAVAMPLRTTRHRWDSAAAWLRRRVEGRSRP